MSLTGIAFRVDLQVSHSVFTMPSREGCTWKLRNGLQRPSAAFTHYTCCSRLWSSLVSTGVWLQLSSSSPHK